MTDPLTPRQQRFVDGWAANNKEAAVRAGYGIRPRKLPPAFDFNEFLRNRRRRGEVLNGTTD